MYILFSKSVNNYMACLSHDYTNVLIFVSNVLILNLFFKPTCCNKVNVLVYTYHSTIFYDKKKHL